MRLDINFAKDSNKIEYKKTKHLAIWNRTAFCFDIPVDCVVGMVHDKIKNVELEVCIDNKEDENKRHAIDVFLIIYQKNGNKTREPIDISETDIGLLLAQADPWEDSALENVFNH